MTKTGKYKIRRHRPGFVEVDEPATETTFETAEQLFAIPWVKQWSDDPEFDHFERHQTKMRLPDGAFPDQLLMAVMKSGKFWVVAYVDNAFELIW